MQRILFRHPIFGVAFVSTLSIIVTYFAATLTETIVAINWWIRSSAEPSNPFPDLSQIDLPTRLNAVFGVLRYFVQGGSLWEPRLAQTSWPTSFLILGGTFVLSSICLLLTVLGRGLWGVAAIGIGALLMIGVALISFAAILASHGGGNRMNVVLALILVFLAVGAWGICIAWKGRDAV